MLSSGGLYYWHILADRPPSLAEPMMYAEPMPLKARRFERLAAEWKSATKVLSSITSKAMHPAYQQIIGMGPEVLPLILARLEEAPDHWFWALKAISGEDPVPPEGRGKIEEMRQAWLEWGRKKGYLLSHV
jgi:hypothetical protein